MKLAAAFLLLSFLARCTAQTKAFTANVIYSNLPGVDGRMTAGLSYDYNLQLEKNVYGAGPIEYFNFTSRLRYLVCGSICDTETWARAMPIYFTETSDTLTENMDATNCTERKKASAASGVTSIYVDTADIICSAKMADGSSLTFTNVVAANLLTVEYAHPTNCPIPACSKKIDFELAFDESGSIPGSDFKIMKTFAGSIANSYTWGPNYASMGLTFFGTVSRLVVPLTNSKTLFLQSLGRAYQNGGSTCVGCGITAAFNDVSNNGRKNPDGSPVNRVFIILSDGKNSIGDFRPALANAKAAGVTFFCIGVGDYDAIEVEEIGSDLSGVNTTFYGNSFSALPTILNGLITATCVDIPGNPCGLGCRGFCACRGNCICPDLCEDGNLCTDDTCTAGIGGNACLHTTRDCDDGNACTSDFCSPSLGCQSVPLVCNDDNICTLDQCDPGYGCIYPVDFCDDSRPCTNDTCDPTLKNATTGCINTPIPRCAEICEDPKLNISCPNITCMINECDPNLSGPEYCNKRPKLCVDSNPCTIDQCSNATGLCIFPPKDCDDKNACTIDGCNATTGACFNLPIEVAKVCNDFNACTADLCAPLEGCYHTNLTCSDTNTCTFDYCNSVTGCYNPPVDCWTFAPDLIAHPDLSGCFAANCSNNIGCKLFPLPGTGVDQCGVCNGDNTSCDLVLGSTQTIGIGAGIIAAIVIASVVLCAIIGALGGKKGYDVWLKHRPNMQGANTSPLYSSEGLSGTNPMYSGDQ